MRMEKVKQKKNVLPNWWFDGDESHGRIRKKVTKSIQIQGILIHWCWISNPTKIAVVLQISHHGTPKKPKNPWISSPLFFKSRQNHIPSWWLSWTNPFEKYYMTLVKLDHLPNFRGENQKSLKPPTRYSHVSCPQNKIAHSFLFWNSCFTLSPHPSLHPPREKKSIQ